MNAMVTGVSMLVLAEALHMTVQQPTMTLGQVLVLSLQNLSAGADAPAFERRVFDEMMPAARQAGPGWQLHLTRKDREPHAGQYLLAWTLDRTAMHGKAIVPNGLPVGDWYQAYELIGADKLGALPAVDVLAVHFIKVKPDRRDGFDRFVAEKLNPMVGTLRPDLRLLYYKPVGGSEPGAYVTVFALTRASRDQYWPNGSDSEELKTAMKPAQALTDELKTYLVEDSYATGNLAAAVYESKDWGDWVVMR